MTFTPILPPTIYRYLDDLVLIADNYDYLMLVLDDILEDLQYFHEKVPLKLSHAKYNCILHKEGIQESSDEEEDSYESRIKLVDWGNMLGLQQ